MDNHYQSTQFLPRMFNSNLLLVQNMSELRLYFVKYPQFPITLFYVPILTLEVYSVFPCFDLETPN